MNIDFLDKMPDKSKDLKILCETGMNDLIKVILLEFDKEMEADEAELKMVERFISK